jgi:hypothetical protein
LFNVWFSATQIEQSPIDSHFLIIGAAMPDVNVRTFS